MKEIPTEVSAEIRADVRRARQRAEEAELDSLLKAYIENDSRFQYGGVVNLMTTIAAICENKSIRTGDDWERAADAIRELSVKLDLAYPETQ